MLTDPAPRWPTARVVFYLHSRPHAGDTATSGSRFHSRMALHGVTIVMWLCATDVISVASNYIITEQLAAENKPSSTCTGALHTRSSTHALHTCPCAPDTY